MHATIPTRDCPGEKVEAPQRAFERAFLPKHFASKESLRWLEQTNRQAQANGQYHIHHAMCGQGGERWIEGAPVEGYSPETKKVFQYHGCNWHGCPKCFPDNRYQRIQKGKLSHHENFVNTKKRTEALRAAGYKVEGPSMNWARGSAAS